MDVTEPTRALVLQALRKKKQTRVWLAEQLGLNKSWATRFFNGQIKTLSHDQMERLQEVLEIELVSLTRRGGSKMSSIAKLVAQEIDSNEAFAEVATSLHHAMKDKIYTPRYIPTKEMSKIGSEIIAICEENQAKPGKVARLVLELLA